MIYRWGIKWVVNCFVIYRWGIKWVVNCFVIYRWGIKWVVNCFVIYRWGIKWVVNCFVIYRWGIKWVVNCFVIYRWGIKWVVNCFKSPVKSNNMLIQLSSKLVLFIWIGANNYQLRFPMGQTSDSEQCSNWLKLDLFSFLVNFACELEQIMSIYDFLWARRVILSNARTDFKIT